MLEVPPVGQQCCQVNLELMQLCRAYTQTTVNERGVGNATRPSTALVEKKARLRVSSGLSFVNSVDRLCGSDSPVRDELSTWNVTAFTGQQARLFQMTGSIQLDCTAFSEFKHVQTRHLVNDTKRSATNAIHTHTPPRG